MCRTICSVSAPNATPGRIPPGPIPLALFPLALFSWPYSPGPTFPGPIPLALSPLALSPGLQSKTEKSSKKRCLSHKLKNYNVLIHSLLPPYLWATGTSTPS